MTEYKFQVTIVPENYDYGEEEIVYRIYFDDQLISERSLPILQTNQAITENFTLLLENNYKTKSFIFETIKDKKAVIEKININGLTFDKNVKKIQTQGLDVNIKEYINKLEEISNGLSD
ncbi:MAG: hypothetical protein EBY16_06680 [Gammaproteobacteria bacterium]|nr:hypothetical protein [Gammaproteobacteria bacterium]